MNVMLNVLFLRSSCRNLQLIVSCLLTPMQQLHGPGYYRAQAEWTRLLTENVPFLSFVTDYL